MRQSGEITGMRVVARIGGTTCAFYDARKEQLLEPLMMPRLITVIVGTGNDKMMRYLLVLALLLAGLPTLAHARVQGHAGTELQQRACRPDVIRHCRGMEDNDRAMANCLRANMQKLRPACRQALEAGR
jgi:hypothetical protein